VVINAASEGVGHPHNDYLRLWHDFGVVGLLLFLGAVGGWLVILFRNWYHAERSRVYSGQLFLAGALGLLGVLLAMVTDNVIVYVFVMGPLGVLVGAGLGLRVP
jgi:O-antigen ligase